MGIMDILIPGKEKPVEELRGMKKYSKKAFPNFTFGEKMQALQGMVLYKCGCYGPTKRPPGIPQGSEVPSELQLFRATDGAALQVSSLSMLSRPVILNFGSCS